MIDLEVNIRGIVATLCIDRPECRVARSPNPCSKDPGFKTTFRPVTKCEERICQLSVIPGKKAKGVTRYGHIKTKGQGCNAQFVSYSVGPLHFVHKSIPYDDSKFICPSTRSELFGNCLIGQMFYLSLYL